MRVNKFTIAVLVCGVGLAWAGALAIADSSKDSQTAGQPEMKLPAGWTMEDMQAFMEAATPGKMQKRLADEAGVWTCKTTMWMHPGAEPVMSEGKTTITTIMDGRYTKAEMEGEMPGMGPYHGLAIYGYDNVAKQFVSTWIDNFSTGFANGVGKLSDDGKTLTWEFTASCPITKKPVVMREIETWTGPNSKTFEMFGADPKSGKEFQMMRLEMTRKS